MREHCTVTGEIQPGGAGPMTPVRATFTVDSEDPWGVRILFHQGEESVSWVWARDVLTLALASGSLNKVTGDPQGGIRTILRLYPNGSLAITFMFSSDEGETMVEFPAGMLRQFLARATRIPYPTPGMLDAALADLMDHLEDS